MRLSKREFHCCFCLFYVAARETEKKKKKKMEKAPKPYKNSVLKGGHPKMRIFSKNCLTLFVSGREKNALFRAHYLFWSAKMFVDQNSEHQEKLYK